MGATKTRAKSPEPGQDELTAARLAPRGAESGPLFNRNGARPYESIQIEIDAMAGRSQTQRWADRRTAQGHADRVRSPHHDFQKEVASLPRQALPAAAAMSRSALDLQPPRLGFALATPALQAAQARHHPQPAANVIDVSCCSRTADIPPRNKGGGKTPLVSIQFCGKTQRAGISLNITPPLALSVFGVSTSVITTASAGTL